MDTQRVQQARRREDACGEHRLRRRGRRASRAPTSRGCRASPRDEERYARSHRSTPRFPRRRSPRASPRPPPRRQAPLRRSTARRPLRLRRRAPVRAPAHHVRRRRGPALLDQLCQAAALAQRLARRCRGPRTVRRSRHARLHLVRPRLGGEPHRGRGGRAADRRPDRAGGILGESACTRSAVERVLPSPRLLLAPVALGRHPLQHHAPRHLPRHPLRMGLPLLLQAGMVQSARRRAPPRPRGLLLLGRRRGRRPASGPQRRDDARARRRGRRRAHFARGRGPAAAPSEWWRARAAARVGAAGVRGGNQGGYARETERGGGESLGAVPAGGVLFSSFPVLALVVELFSGDWLSHWTWRKPKNTLQPG